MGTVPPFSELIAATASSAVHLEMRDAYTPDDQRFLDWLAGKPLPRPANPAWSRLVRARRFREEHPDVIIGDGGFGTPGRPVSPSRTARWSSPGTPSASCSTSSASGWQDAAVSQPAPLSMPLSLPGRNRDGTAVRQSRNGAGREASSGQTS
jgi:uncharacterized protein DUF6879